MKRESKPVLQKEARNSRAKRAGQWEREGHWRRARQREKEKRKRCCEKRKKRHGCLSGRVSDHTIGKRKGRKHAKTDSYRGGYHGGAGVLRAIFPAAKAAGLAGARVYHGRANDGDSGGAAAQCKGIGQRRGRGGKRTDAGKRAGGGFIRTD